MQQTSSLFPIAQSKIIAGFTTASYISIPNIANVTFSDESLGVHNVTANTTHAVVVPPPPRSASTLFNSSDYQEAWEAIFPEGSINPGNKNAPPGGFGFYLRGPPEFADALHSGISDEVLMSYEVMFEEEFDWVKGGKLPGVYGGVGGLAYRCTGGRQSDRCSCFNLRLMWRGNGAGELYAYLPISDANTARLIEVPPKSFQHPDYGFSAGRGSFRFDSGKWYIIAERLKMNTLGQNDGEIDVFIDGQPAIQIRGLSLRDSKDACVQGLHCQTFFGGHSTDWASPRDQRAWLTHISGAVLKSDPLSLRSFSKVKGEF